MSIRVQLILTRRQLHHWHPYGTRTAPTGIRTSYQLVAPHARPPPHR